MEAERYIAVTVPCPDNEQREQLIGLLSVLGYEGFEEKETELIACRPEAGFEEGPLLALLEPLGLDYRLEVILPVNWNASWESSFQPVRVDGFCGIRAAFHPPLDDVAHEIVITPKMSFGTGHHATTCSMIRLMRDLDFHGKNVLDFGTGTGILAILAVQCGARAVLAVDHDVWAVENAAENCAANDAAHIAILRADTVPAQEQPFDIILANINLYTILDNLEKLQQQLSANGCLLVSGILSSDREAVINGAAGSGLHPAVITESEGWLAMRLQHSL